MLGKINWSPDNRQLRTFGKTLVIGFAIIGTVLAFAVSRSTGAWVAGIGIGVGLLAIAAPRLSLPFYLAWMGFGFVMGTIVSTLILTFIFFGLLTPLALVMRLTKRDELRLRKKAAGESYWLQHPALDDKTYYERLS